MQNEFDTLSDVIKKAREKCGLSIGELADRIGVTERHLYRIENENKKPSIAEFKSSGISLQDDTPAIRNCSLKFT